jgi:2-oxoglutarate ferredoxin oxidoreductase subunit alpha
VSAFQVHISDHEITTPGDAPNVLVAMNPAALRSELHRLVDGGTLIVNTDAFDERNLTKAGYTANPLTDGSLDHVTVYEVPMTTLTKDAVAALGVKPRDAERSKNFFALGLISWMYTRPEEPTLAWIDEKFAKPQVAAANRAVHRRARLRRDGRAVRAPVLGPARASVPPAPTPTSPATWPLAWGLVAAGQLAGCRCSSAATRSRRRPTSCTSSPSTRASASARSRPKTRSPGSAPPSARRSGATSRSPPRVGRASPSSPRPWAWP